MPIYEYECSKCGHAFEREQSMSEPPVKTCPKCKARKVTKLISRSSFVLKGGGWYADGYADAKKKAAATDSASSTPSDSPAASESTSTTSETKSSTDAKSSDSSKKTESKPAKTAGKAAKPGKASGKSAA